MNFTRTMRVFILIIFLLTAADPLFSQPGSLFFRNLNTANGLSHNKINCIREDRRGFIWIGTEDGLNRYDGHRFEVYRHDPSDPASVSGNIITDILEDKNGILWISTSDGGISAYDYRAPAHKRFRPYKHSSIDSTSIPLNIINALAEDASGNIWLATSGHGILRFDKERGIFSEPVRSRVRTILDLLIDEKGIIWGGRQGGGLIRIDPVTLRADEDARYSNVYAKLPHMTVTSLFRDHRNNIWMGSWDKVVYRVDAETGLEKVYKPGKPGSFPGDDPLSFAEDHKNNIWIAGRYGGLYVFDPVTENFSHYSHDPSKDGSLTGNQVNVVYINRTGMVLVGTNNGLSIHDPSRQQFVQQFLPGNQNSGNTIYDFSEQNDELWIGTSDGLYILNKHTGSIPHKTLSFRGEPLAITHFYRDAEEGMFVGTQLSLFKMNTRTFKLELLPNTHKDVVMNRIIESRVVSVVKDTIEGRPALITVPYGHYMAYFDYSENRWVSRLDSSKQIVHRFNLRDNLIRKFFKSSDGNLWVATAKMGIGLWIRGQKEQLVFFNNAPGDSTSITNNHVYDIKEDKNGNLWVSTYGGGLHYFNTAEKTFRHIAASHNLGEGIQTDDQGNVWMIANGNLHKFDPVKNSYTSFYLPDVEKRGGVRGYIFKDSQGKMIVSGPGYFIRFHPDSIREPGIHPKVYFTDFKIFNTSRNELLFEKEIVLRHNQNYFTVEFSAPSFEGGYPVRYSHQLEGVDQGWIDDGTQNLINYTNLDGGRYVFNVRATAKPGVWSPEIAVLTIRIIPPYWATIWFYLLVAAITAALIYGIYRYRVNEILRRQAIRNKIAQDLHDNVGSTLSSISVYSQVAKIYNQQKKTEQLQDTLEKISSTSGEMISELNDIVWAINPRNDNMDTMLQRMESFARPLLVSQAIQLHFDYDSAVKYLVLDMTRRKNFYLIFKEAVNNALKYSECKNVWVTIRLRGHSLELTVKDDGKGFDKQTLKAAHNMGGNGLHNMQQRAGEIKGQYSIISSPGAGTTVKLSFPIP